MKIIFFHGDDFSLMTYLISEIQKKDSIVLASSSRFETRIFYLKRSISKFDIRLGQVKVRS